MCIKVLVLEDEMRRNYKKAWEDLKKQLQNQLKNKDKDLGTKDERNLINTVTGTYLANIDDLETKYDLLD